MAGAVWSPLVQHFIETVGWRQTYIGMGIFCLCSMLPLALWVLRKRPPPHAPHPAEPEALSAETIPHVKHAESARPLGFSPAALQGLLCVAGVACCVAMSMPQVHIVAYCGDLGFGFARGAEMLSLMLAAGIVSRLVSGWISDHIGGLRTLLPGSVLQGIALLVREYFTPKEAGARVGTILIATLSGMALGGWMSGAIFDLTGSYRAAFLNGTAWNLLNISIVLLLIYRERGGRRQTLAAAHWRTGSGANKP